MGETVIVVTTAAIFTALLTFGSGFAYEFGCVFWVHHSEQGNAKRAALWSAFNALTQIVGIGASLQQPVYAACFVFGFAAGSYVAVARKRSLQPTPHGLHVSTLRPGDPPPRPKGATGFPGLSKAKQGGKG